jgi:hypothetical protein
MIYFVQCVVAGIVDRVRIILNRILWLIHVFSLESNVILKPRWQSWLLLKLLKISLFCLALLPEYPNPQTNQIVFGLPYSAASTLPEKKSRKATLPDLDQSPRSCGELSALGKAWHGGGQVLLVSRP